LYQAACTNGLCEIKPDHSDFERSEVFDFIWGGQLESCGQYQHGLKEGLWRYFDRNGRCWKQGYFQNGLKTGCWKWRAGKECFYHQGLRHGPYREYFENPYENLNESADFFSQRRVAREGYYTHGTKTGNWIDYPNIGLTKQFNQLNLDDQLNSQFQTSRTQLRIC